MEKLMRYGSVVYVVILALFSGCSEHLMDPEINFKPPKYVEELPPRDPIPNRVMAGSLFGQGENPLFSDRKAMNVNDIVTVVISENISSSSSAQKSLAKNNDTNLGAGLITPTGALQGNLNSAINRANKLGNVGFTSTTANSFSGTGSNKRTETFTATVTARVVKILNNGNYFIIGNRELLIDGEKQNIQLSGVISPYDINQNNTIDSMYISDAKIVFKTEGELKQGSTKGWGTRALETIWPF